MPLRSRRAGIPTSKHGWKSLFILPSLWTRIYAFTKSTVADGISLLSASS
ncbi:Uncharacterised protein [Mycobacterium tuberculosis]|nr:Uncharacterised protein [Mycobacterium tuberculosis]